METVGTDGSRTFDGFAGMDSDGNVNGGTKGTAKTTTVKADAVEGNAMTITTDENSEASTGDSGASANGATLDEPDKTETGGCPPGTPCDGKWSTASSALPVAGTVALVDGPIPAGDIIAAAIIIGAIAWDLVKPNTKENVIMPARGFKGGSQSQRDRDYGLPKELFDWWHNGGGKKTKWWSRYRLR